MFATMFCALAKSSQLLRLEATPAISMDLVSRWRSVLIQTLM